MTTKELTAEALLLDIFGGNPYHARAREVSGDISYQPMDVALTEENLKAHTEGKMTLGSYQLLQGSNVVKWLGWDVDSSDLKQARELVQKIIRHLPHLPYVIEYSGRKGYHILIFLDEPMPAGDAKRVVEWVREIEGFKSIGETHVECFPKQDRLTRDRPKGNLLKIPLGCHPKTHEQSIFVDMYNGWENGAALSPLELLQYRSTIKEVMQILEAGPNPNSQLVELLSTYWVDGNRHDMSLYLCGFLANEGWTVDQTKDLVEEICVRTGDEELRNRHQTITTTFQRFRKGKTVRGRQGLAEFLPASVMQKLTELASIIKSPDTVLQIDEIRYIKGKPKIEAVRLASSTMWSILNDGGCRIFQTNNGRAYWYNSETHKVLEEGTEDWQALLNKDFGLNPVDNFSRMAYSELRLRIVREAPIIDIHNRTFWDSSSGKLYVNMGGPEVYIISGEDKIETAYNGQCGYMFVTNPSGEYTVPDFEGEPLDAWDNLVADLSFAISTDAPATPSEQRELLKAWILSYFFQELMPTKPILALIGAPGSGKTTAIRRVLRILEDPTADVLGIPTDKQDAFRSSIEKHRLLVIDNLEKSGAWWMVDMLNKLATGNHIEVRQLYKTNATHIIIPKCYVAITAVNIPFSDETLFSRLLVLELDCLDEPLPEHQLQKRILESGALIWGDLIRKLGIVVDTLNANVSVKAPTKSRLVDFTVFCERIKNCSVMDGKNLSMGLLAMVDSQMKQLTESSQAVMLLGEWIELRPEEAAEWRSFVQLYEVLQNMAHARKKKFQWRSAQALYRHFSTLEERLQREFQAEIKTEETGSKRDAIKIRFRTVMT